MAPTWTWTPFPGCPWTLITWKTSRVQSLRNSAWTQVPPVSTTPSPRLFLRTLFGSASLWSNSLPLRAHSTAKPCYILCLISQVVFTRFSFLRFCLCLLLSVCTALPVLDSDFSLTIWCFCLSAYFNKDRSAIAFCLRPSLNLTRAVSAVIHHCWSW